MAKKVTAAAINVTWNSADSKEPSQIALRCLSRVSGWVKKNPQGDRHRSWRLPLSCLLRPPVIIIAFYVTSDVLSNVLKMFYNKSDLVEKAPSMWYISSLLCGRACVAWELSGHLAAIFSKTFPSLFDRIQHWTHILFYPLWPTVSSLLLVWMNLINPFWSGGCWFGLLKCTHWFL